MKCISIDNVSVVLTQHPQIQKKSQYIKYLCCDDVRTLHQWVNGIRIAKVIFCFGVNVYNVICMYSMCIMLGFVAESMWFLMQYGKQLYVNYQEAMRRTEAAHDWSSLSSSSIKSGSSSSSLPGKISSAPAEIQVTWDMRQYLMFNRLFCIVVYETDYRVSMFVSLLNFWLIYTFMPTESQSNHSSQSDSGVSETTSSGHVRSQSVVSSIFSEAWKRGNQADEPKVTIEELYFKSLLALLRSTSVSSSWCHCYVS